MAQVRSRRALLLAILFLGFFFYTQYDVYSDDPLPLESLIMIPMIAIEVMLQMVKLTEDSVHTALYQRVSIDALAGTAFTYKICCG